MRFQGKAPKTILTGVVGAAVLAASVACGATAPAGPVGPEWLGVCVDPVTGDRVPESDCGGENALGAALATAYVWDYIDTYRYPSYRMPAYGTRVNITNITVVHSVPRGSSVSRSVPRTGGSASSVRTSLGSKSSTSGSGTGKSTSGSGSITRGGLGVSSGSSSGGISSRGGSISAGS